MTPLGPGFFIFFQEDVGNGYSGAFADGYQEVVGEAAFKEYIKEIEKPIEVFQKIEVAQKAKISPKIELNEAPRSLLDIQIRQELIKKEIVQRQVEEWPDAIRYIEELEDVSAKLAKELFIVRTYDELNRRLLQDEEEAALLLILIEAT